MAAAARALRVSSRSTPRQKTCGHSSARALVSPKTAPRCARSTCSSPAPHSAAYAPAPRPLTTPRRPQLPKRTRPRKKQRPTAPADGVNGSCRCGCRCLAASRAQRSCACSSAAGRSALCWYTKPHGAPCSATTAAMVCESAASESSATRTSVAAGTATREGPHVRSSTLQPGRAAWAATSSRVKSEPSSTSSTGRSGTKPIFNDTSGATG
mmetsp:Transcript_7120/g.16707  ORF Transcript_7120/g.16707 Transcript_7120/m.16707 type:complete len:211 (+) Transcript_7120:430-1062(+)